jgi:hypothetical protein
MKSLKEMKQKGRALRKHLEAAFGKEVSLSQAYEALAAMEGATSWNALSAALVAPTTQPEQPLAPQPLPEIRAVFRTVDGNATAAFDASPWFAQASQSDIDDLVEETTDKGPHCFSRSIGGNHHGDSVAEFFDDNEDVAKVYAYIKATRDIGQDCGGSDCFIDADDVNKWLEARTRSYTADGLFSELNILEVNLVNVLNEYDVPDDVLDWQWVEEHHSFAHRGNGVEGGVWEYLVHVEQMEDPDFVENIPATLRPFFELALEKGYAWVMFHQG